MGAACGSEAKDDTPVIEAKGKSSSKDASKSPNAAGKKGKEDKKENHNRRMSVKKSQKSQRRDSQLKKEEVKKEEKEKVKDPTSQNSQERLSREEARKNKKEKSLESRGSSNSRTYTNSCIAVDDNDPVFAVASKASKSFDFDDETHILLGKVCDFVCGAEAPPAPTPTTYMERGLAMVMMQYQSQMFAEVKASGLEPGTEHMIKPELAAMWELERFFPSSEDADLRVVNLKFLAVCREMGTSAMCTMNIFCQGERSSGFTLDNVKLVDTKYISAELIDMAQERYQTRRMGIVMGTDLFEGDYDLRTPIHICASEGEIETAIFLLKIAKGDKAKISPKDRWGGTPLGDARRGLKKDPGNHGFEEVVRLFEEAGADGDDRGHFKTIDVALDENPEAVEIIEAAASGDLAEMRRYGTNPNLFSCDYDSRTALHLAASNGHLSCVKWLLGKMENSEVVRNAGHHQSTIVGADTDDQPTTDEKLAKVRAKLRIINYQDRFYGTPLIDANREGHPDVAKELQKWIDKCHAEIKKLEEAGDTPAPDDNNKEEATDSILDDEDAAAFNPDAAADTTTQVEDDSIPIEKA